MKCNIFYEKIFLKFKDTNNTENGVSLKLVEKNMVPVGN